jgi:hypothetical protein
MNSIGTALLVLVMFFILAAWIGGCEYSLDTVSGSETLADEMSSLPPFANCSGT